MNNLRTLPKRPTPIPHTTLAGGGMPSEAALAKLMEGSQVYISGDPFKQPSGTKATAKDMTPARVEMMNAAVKAMSDGRERTINDICHRMKRYPLKIIQQALSDAAFAGLIDVSRLDGQAAYRMKDDAQQ